MLRKLTALAMVAGMVVAFSGCGEKGPAEKAGAAVDQGAKNVQKGADDAGKKLNNAAKELQK